MQASIKGGGIVEYSKIQGVEIVMLVVKLTELGNKMPKQAVHQTEKATQDDMILNPSERFKKG